MSTINVRGGSTSSLAEVDNNGLRTRRNSEWDVALDAGLAFSWSSATYDYTAIDTVCYVQNNSGKYDLKIKRIFITGDTESQFIVHSSKGVTIGEGAQGAAIVGVNLNRGSARLATSLATARSDEEGNTQSTAYLGKVVTGILAAAGVVDIDLEGALVLPNDHDVGVDLTTNGAACNVTIWGYFVPIS